MNIERNQLDIRPRITSIFRLEHKPADSTKKTPVFSRVSILRPDGKEMLCRI